MKLFPDKFMPVHLQGNSASDWDDLEKMRAKHAPILGRDDWFETLKYNAASLLFCDLMSKAFVWVLISIGLLVHFKLESSLLIYNLVGALLHFAAKDEFKKVVSAFCSKWGGVPAQGGPDGKQLAAPVQPKA